MPNRIAGCYHLARCKKLSAIVYSYSTKPPELFVMLFTAAAKPVRVTTSPSEEWTNFKWMSTRR